MQHATNHGVSPKSTNYAHKPTANEDIHMYVTTAKQKKVSHKQKATTRY